MVEILTDIIYYCSRNKEVRKKEDNDLDFWLSKISNNACHCLRYCIRSNSPNELYCFQWLNLILEQIVNNGESGGKMKANQAAGKLFTELLENVESIIDTRITSETIHNIVKYIVESDQANKYVSILRALCICNGRAMLKNQVTCSKLILLNSKILPYFLFSLQLREEEIYISNQRLGLEPHSIDEFQQGVDSDPDLKLFDYAIEVFKLFGDLCFQGNSTAIRFLQNHYDFDIIFAVLNHEEVRIEVKEIFCRLLTYLWVDLPGYSKLSLDLTIIQWENLKDNYTLPSIDLEDQFRFKPIKYYIFHTLKYQLNSISVKTKNAIHQFSYLNSIINLAKTMVELGLYAEIEEINELLSALKKLIINSLLSHNTIRQLKSQMSLQNKVTKGVSMTVINDQTVDLNLSLASMKVCSLSIAQFFQLISKIQIFMKQNSLVYRLKNLIETNYIPFLYENYNNSQKKAKEEEIISKVGFMIKAITEEESQLKLNLQKSGVTETVSIFMGLSFEDDPNIKQVSFDYLFSYFSNTKILSETIQKLCSKRPLS
jgi:hypothetical protein